MAGVPQPNSAKTFYLETFGCQMNVHDSEKVIGTLLHEGYRQVETVEQADLILYNTCSIRYKAEQKVFHRLADYKKLLAQGKKFGVLGCVAQQEGEKIFERAPHVSLVCGSASYRNLPQMLTQLESESPKLMNVSRRNLPPEPILIADTSLSSRVATNSAPTAWFHSRAGKSAAVPPIPSSPKLARWPISATRKFSCWARTSTPIKIRQGSRVAGFPEKRKH